MSFLHPLFLLAGGLAAVPLLLHLLHRRERRSVPFPALRYLERTTREHARTIRARQLLLLLLRIAAVLLLVLAGARILLPGSGRTHDPTALVIVLDNGPGSGMVVEGRRALDPLLDAARESIRRAGPDDRIWILRGGDVGDLPLPGGVRAAGTRVDATLPGSGSTPLAELVARALVLIEDSGMDRGEIHLLPDLRRAMPGDATLPPLPPAISLVVLDAGSSTEPNRGVTEISIGEDLPPVAGARTRISARIEGDSGRVGVRLLVDGVLAGVQEAGGGETVVFEAGPFPAGWVEGRVEIDADALRADDARAFAFRVAAPPGVGLPAVPSSGEGEPFLREALGVLEEGGRIRRVSSPPAEAWILMEGAPGPDLPPGVSVILIPPANPERLPAANRALTEAGLPWRFEGRNAAERTVRSTDLPVPLRALGVRGGVGLRAPEAPRGRILAVLDDGSPWLVSDEDRSGRRWLLIGTPLTPEFTDLPVRAAMIPFVEWALLNWGSGGSGARTYPVGAGVVLPDDARSVVTPSGRRDPIGDPSRPYPLPEPGIHRVLGPGDSLLALLAAGIDRSVSLPRGDRRDADGHPLLPPGAVAVPSVDAWGEAIFPGGAGPEGWRALALAALLLLLIEGWLAGSRGSRNGIPTRG